MTELTLIDSMQAEKSTALCSSRDFEPCSVTGRRAAAGGVKKERAIKMGGRYGYVLRSETRSGRQRFKLVPLRRLFEMHLDDLLLIRDVKPAPVTVPTFRDDLNQCSAQWSVGNVRDAVTIGLYVEFQLFVFP